MATPDWIKIDELIIHLACVSKVIVADGLVEIHLAYHEGNSVSNMAIFEGERAAALRHFFDQHVIDVMALFKTAQQPVPAGASASYPQQVLDAAGWVHEHTGGILVPLPDELHPDQVKAMLAHIKSEYRRMVAKHDPPQPDQLDTLAKLWLATGKPIEAMPKLSAYGCSLLCAQLIEAEYAASLEKTPAAGGKPA